MLSPGHVRWAFVAFENRPSVKTRPVLILHVLRDTVIVAAGGSRWKDRLTLLLALDGAHPDTGRIKLWSDTYFYAENVREIPIEDLGEQIGVLSKGETQRVIAEVNEM